MDGHPEGIRFLDQPLDDEEAWAGWLGVRPTHVPAEIEMGAASHAVGTQGLVSNFYYWSRPDMDEEYVYNLAKWFHENFDDYKDSHPLAQRMSLELFLQFIERSPMPVHEGTVQYLRDIGEWTDEHEENNQEARENMDRWLKAREEAMIAAMNQGIEPRSDNEAFLELLDEHTEDLPTFRTRL